LQDVLERLTHVAPGVHGGRVRHAHDDALDVVRRYACARLAARDHDE
jgi:hypothetical protein